MRKAFLGIIFSMFGAFSFASKIKNCGIAKCLEETGTTEQTKCYYREYNDTSRSIQVKKCPEGQTCSYTYWEDEKKEEITGTQDGNCKKIIPKTTNLLPTEKCTDNAECASKNCTNSKCLGRALDAECNIHEECDIGLACISNKCTSQKEKGAACVNDQECLNNAGCHKGICTEYFTLNNGDETNNAKLCKSYNTIEYNGKTICADLTKEENADHCESEEGNCYFSADVGEKEKQQVKINCRCSLVNQDKKFCTFETTTKDYTDAVSSIKSSLDTKKKYHTMIREKAESNSANKKIFILKNTPVFENITDSCIIDALYENGVILRPISFISFIVFSLALLF